MASIKLNGRMLKPKIKPNVCSAMLPVYYFAKCLGIMPYTLIIRDDKCTPITSKINGFYTLIFGIVYIPMAVHTMISLYQDEADSFIMPKYTVIIQNSLQISLMFVFMTCGFIFRNSIIKSMVRLCSIDETLTSVKLDMDYVKTHKWVLMKMVFVGVSTVLRVILMIVIMHIDAIQVLLLAASIFIKGVAKNHFVILGVQVCDRYIKINETIRSMFPCKSATLQLTVGADPKIKGVMKMLYVLCRVHYKLRKIVQNLVTAYSIQLLAYLGVTLSNIIFQSYFFYLLITLNRNNRLFVFYGASSILWLLDEVYELYNLVRTCSTTCNIAAETATILHQLRNAVKNIELESHIQMYSLQMLHQQLQFSALGFVTVDYSLLYSMIGAVTTYLVILIQFDQAQISIANARMMQMANNLTNIA